MQIYIYNILLFIASAYVLIKINKTLTLKTLGNIDQKKVTNWQKEMMKTGYKIGTGKGNFTELVTVAGENIDAYKELIKLLISYAMPFFIIIMPLEIIMKNNPLAKIGGVEITWVLVLLALFIGVIITKIITYAKKRKSQ